MMLHIGTSANATQIAVVEVDVELGAVTLRRYVVVEDCGRINNPMIVEGQAIGGVETENTAVRAAAGGEASASDDAASASEPGRSKLTQYLSLDRWRAVHVECAP